MAEIEMKRMLYKAAVEDMENNVYPSYNSCAKHYGLNHSTLKRLHDTGGEYIGHNKSNFKMAHTLKNIDGISGTSKNNWKQSNGSNLNV